MTEMTAEEKTHFDAACKAFAEARRNVQETIKEGNEAQAKLEEVKAGLEVTLRC